MNIQHIKYAIEVEKAGSISQAADNLFLGQPNLSKSIKELEQSVGIRIFERTKKGVAITVKGREFLADAKKALDHLEEVENRYKRDNTGKKFLSVSAPHSSYIIKAFCDFTNGHDPDEEMEADFRECGSADTIKNISENDSNIGIIRYSPEFEFDFKRILSGYNLTSKLICEFECSLLMAENHPLARKDEIYYEDLEPYIEISHEGRGIKDKSHMANGRNIRLHEQGNQIYLITCIQNAFMWTKELPEGLLRQWGLKQRTCADFSYRLMDVLIYPSGYRLSPMEKSFVKKLETEIAAEISNKLTNVKEEKVINYCFQGRG